MSANMIIVSLAEQKLSYWEDQETPILSYRIVSAAPGEIENSFKTPRGRHIVIEKIGDGEPIDTIFVGRKPVGMYTDAIKHTRNDFILTRILRLSGMDKGFNLGGSVDSLSRHIYIHGTPEIKDGDVSHGCVRVQKNEMLHLFNIVPIHTQVLILEGPMPAYPVDIALFTSPQMIRTQLETNAELKSQYSEQIEGDVNTCIASRQGIAVGFLQWQKKDHQIHCLSMATIESHIGIETQLLSFLISKAFLLGHIETLSWLEPNSIIVQDLQENLWTKESSSLYVKAVNHGNT